MFSPLIYKKFGTYRDRMNNSFKPPNFSVDANNLLQVPAFGVLRKDVYITCNKINKIRNSVLPQN